MLHISCLNSLEPSGNVLLTCGNPTRPTSLVTTTGPDSTQQHYSTARKITAVAMAAHLFVASLWELLGTECWAPGCDVLTLISVNLIWKCLNIPLVVVVGEWRSVLPNLCFSKLCPSWKEQTNERQTLWPEKEFVGGEMAWQTQKNMGIWEGFPRRT